jgi:hypothetical protein
MIIGQVLPSWRGVFASRAATTFDFVVIFGFGSGKNLSGPAREPINLSIGPNDCLFA